MTFLCRNSKRFPLQSKELLYTTNVRPIRAQYAYACTVWGPETKNIDKLQKAQILAVHIVLNTYSKNFSVSATQKSFGWVSLQGRRYVLRQKFFRTIYHSKTGTDRDHYFHQTICLQKGTTLSK